MLLFLGFVVIYVGSFIGAYKEIQRIHQEVYKTLLPNLMDLFMVFAPIFNTILTIHFVYNKLIKKHINNFYEKNGSLLAKFFRIK